MISAGAVESFVANYANKSSLMIPPKEVFENGMAGFNCFPLHHWVNENEYVTPVTAITVYLLLVFVVIPAVRPRTPPAALKHLFALWNLFLSVFSAYGVYVCAPAVYAVIRDLGVRHIVCSDLMMMGPQETLHVACYGHIGFMMSIFMLSKFPELIDTLFLAAMRKPIAFIHWYHHITVLLYSWFAYRNATPTAFFFGTMNFTVHAVMYFYFAFSTYSHALSFMRKPITLLQLSQMFVGVMLTVLAYVFTNDSVGCSVRYLDGSFFTFCFTMYGSYLFLFAKLYVDNYLHRRGKKGATKNTKSSASITAAAERKRK